MADGRMTRRDFLQTSASAAAAGGLAMGIGALGPNAAEAAGASDVAQTRSYNPGMEYRRLGKTGLWISAVCLGGHWKRIDTALKTVEPKEGRSPFDQNRYDVVTRCIEAGINYIDACWSNEVVTYTRAEKRTPRQNLHGMLLGRQGTPLRAVPHQGRAPEYSG